MMCQAQLIALTPLIRSAEHNLIRIERTNDIHNNNVQFVASGPFKGIVLNKLTTKYEEYPTQFPCSFSVWISSDGGKTLKQEVRSFRFCFYPYVPLVDRAAASNRFIRNLFDGNFPKDYANFVKMLLSLMQSDYPEFCAIDVEMKFASDVEKMPMPSAKQLANDDELENVSSGHVKEALEHAYPNSIPEETLAINLRCTLEEAQTYLAKLEIDGIAERVLDQPGEWIRKTFTLPQTQHNLAVKKPPKIAIITCLFPEKLCVDTIVENSSTEHSYSNTGGSNIYTEGEIAGHRIVATKLSMIGTNREAATSAGSITTRLLGKYQQIEHVIIVGVGGGQAHLTDPEMHIRLGDVVISHGGMDDSTGIQIGAYMHAHNIVINSKTDDIGFELRSWSPKDNTLARSIRNADSNAFLAEWHSASRALIARLNEKYKNQHNFSRPPQSSDAIFHLTANGNVIVFPHPNEHRTNTLYHLGPIGSMVTFCTKPATDEQQQQKSMPPKTPLKPKNHPSFGNNTAENGENLKSTDQPLIPMKENIAADDSAGENKTNNENGNNNDEKAMRIENERLREKFRLNYHLCAFDAGFDSVIAAIVGSRVDSWVLVRGISDYQQGSSNQGKTWQNYAAANAVALVETILHNIKEL